MSEETTQKLIWEIDSTDPEKGETVRNSLREVIDPEIGLNVIELGMIRDVALADSELQVKMILTTPFCPYGPALLEMARSKAEESLAVPAQIELGMDVWDPSMMEDGAGAAWGLF
jgi:metal-sulfur cluster biosynthetic enzyme